MTVDLTIRGPAEHRRHAVTEQMFDIDGVATLFPSPAHGDQYRAHKLLPGGDNPISRDGMGQNTGHRRRVERHRRTSKSTGRDAGIRQPQHPAA